MACACGGRGAWKVDAWPISLAGGVARPISTVRANLSGPAIFPDSSLSRANGPLRETNPWVDPTSICPNDLDRYAADSFLSRTFSEGVCMTWRNELSQCYMIEAVALRKIHFSGALSRCARVKHTEAMSAPLIVQKVSS